MKPFFCDHAISGPVDLLPDVTSIPLDDRPSWARKLRNWYAGMCRHCGGLFISPTPHRGKRLTPTEYGEATVLGLEMVQAHIGQLQLVGSVN